MTCGSKRKDPSLCVIRGLDPTRFTDLGDRKNDAAPTAPTVVIARLDPATCTHLVEALYEAQ